MISGFITGKTGTPGAMSQLTDLCQYSLRRWRGACRYGNQAGMKRPHLPNVALLIRWRPAANDCAEHIFQTSYNVLISSGHVKIHGLKKIPICALNRTIYDHRILFNVPNSVLKMYPVMGNLQAPSMTIFGTHVRRTVTLGEIPLWWSHL